MLNEYKELQRKKEEFFRNSAFKRKIDQEESIEIKKAKEAGAILVCRHAKYSKFVKNKYLNIFFKKILKII